MPEIRDITGQKFGHLTAICYSHTYHSKRYWKFLCDCGNEHVAINRSAISGNIIACGCILNKQNGLSGTSEYGIWGKMIERCCDPDADRYSYYGGRGITVCDRWRNSFTDFYEDMGPKPSPKHTIDRIDNDGNYEPGNCRWATMKEQMNNCSRNVRITFNGVTMTAMQWSEKLGVKYDLICRRVRSGLTDPEQILSPKKVPYGPIRYDKTYAERKQIKLHKQEAAF